MVSFFFSSRRRHTRSTRDWSSDVCSSDLPMAGLDFLVPRHRFWRWWWWLYTRLVLPVAGSVGGRDWIAVGRFLGPNISAHYRRYPLGWAVEAWRDAGMTDVGVREMSLGGGLVMWGTKSFA